MSNSIVSTSNLQKDYISNNVPQEILQHILSFDFPHPALARVNKEFCAAYTDLLRSTVTQIFEQCSSGQTSLNTFINSLRRRFETGTLNWDIIGVSTVHRLIAERIRDCGIASPKKYLSPQEIHRYVPDIDALEDPNLQKVWRNCIIQEEGIRAEVADKAAHLNLPITNVSAAAIRIWMNTNTAALQNIVHLELNFVELTYIPREIALLTGLKKLDLSANKISEIPVGIFNELVRLQELFLVANQISELPVGIFNELKLVGLQLLVLTYNKISEFSVETFNRLKELQEFYINENPQLLVSYKKRQTASQSLLHKNIFNSFHKYDCKSAFAGFYKFAAQGNAFEKVVATFHSLDQPTKNAIYGMVYEEANLPNINDSRWGEHHAFDDKGIFNRALKRYVRRQFIALSEGQKNGVYERVCALAQADPALAHENFSDPNWGREHAEGNVLWLIDAMMADPEALIK